jgi:hypothetical protein
MDIEKCYNIVTKKGGRILYNRSMVGELEVGDKFKVQSLKETFEIMFFFKDHLFDYSPMVFGLCREDGSSILIASRGLITLTEKKLKHKRRI